MEEIFYSNELEELIDLYMDEEIELDEICDFCFDLEVNMENKKMLTEAILGYDIDILYETLLGKFAALLTEEEKQEFKEKYAKAFDDDFDSDELFED